MKKIWLFVILFSIILIGSQVEAAGKYTMNTNPPHTNTYNTNPNMAPYSVPDTLPTRPGTVETRSVPARNYRAAAVNDRNYNWSWLGLFGLIGLFGLAGRNRVTGKE